MIAKVSKASMLVLGVTLAAPLQAQPSAGTFPVSANGWDVSFTSMTGINSANARMTGRATRDSLQYFCERNPGGIAGGFSGCVRKMLADHGRATITVSANCRTRTVRSPNGRLYRLTRAGRAGPTWVDVASGRKLNDDFADDPMTRTIHFNTLCPARAIPD